MRNRTSKLALFAAIALLLAAIPSLAAESTVVGVLKKMSDTSKNLKTLQASYVASITLNMGGNDLTLNVPLDLAIEKPNKFRVDVTSEITNMCMLSDGQHFYDYQPALRQVKVTDAPKDLNQAPPEVMERLKGAGLGLLGGFGDDSIAEKAKGSKFIGIQKLNGRETYAMLINLPVFGTSKVWIGAKDFQLYRMEATLDLSQAMPGAEAMGVGGGGKTVLVAKSIKVDQPIPASTFQFKIPEGVQVIKGGASAPAPESPAEAPAQ